MVYLLFLVATILLLCGIDLGKENVILIAVFSTIVYTVVEYYLVARKDKNLFINNVGKRLIFTHNRKTSDLVSSKDRALGNELKRVKLEANKIIKDLRSEISCKNEIIDSLEIKLANELDNIKNLMNQNAILESSVESKLSILDNAHSSNTNSKYGTNDDNVVIIDINDISFD